MYSNKLEKRFLDYVYSRISETNNPIWGIVGTFRAYLFNYHPECLDEFYYKITDDIDPDDLMYDFSNRFDKNDKQLTLIIDAIPAMDTKKY